MLILQSLSIETVVSYYGYKNVDDNDDENDDVNVDVNKSDDDNGNVDDNDNDNVDEVLMNVYSLWVRF